LFLGLQAYPGSHGYLEEVDAASENNEADKGKGSGLQKVMPLGGNLHVTQPKNV
jgi:hypothetical protein